MNKVHVAIVENALDADLCRAAADAWPAPDWGGWHARYQADHQKKRACNRWEDIPAPLRTILSELLFLKVDSLGLGDLIADTGLWGGGLHDMGTDDVLGLHLDADTHALSGMRRVLNAILFLTPEWQEKWGGHFELWDEDRQRPTLRIAPVFNRLLLFATSSQTWHGVPTPLCCPPDVRRKTLAVWWYARGGHSGERQYAHFCDKKK